MFESLMEGREAKRVFKIVPELEFLIEKCLVVGKEPTVQVHILHGKGLPQKQGTEDVLGMRGTKEEGGSVDPRCLTHMTTSNWHVLMPKWQVVCVLGGLPSAK